MPEIDNRSGLPHFCLEQMGPNGTLFDVLVVRGNFDFEVGGKAMRRANTPYEAWGDEYSPGENMQRALKREGDFVLFKPSTDVYLAGCAHTPNDKPLAQWLATLKVGAIKKELLLSGRRQFERKWGTWMRTAPEPVSALELDARHAFGGCFTTQTAEGEEEQVYRADNPAGCGWLPGVGAWGSLSKEGRRAIQAHILQIKTLPAPQIENPAQEAAHPHSNGVSAGFGPLPQWRKERTRYAGTYDAKWRKERYPRLPKDFDLRFYQAAPPDQICKGYLKGDEAIELTGMTVEGQQAMRLPGLEVAAVMMLASGKKELVQLPLDTVAFDLDRRQALLTWRLAMAQTDAAKFILVDSRG
jgi:hypothetical protein